MPYAGWIALYGAVLCLAAPSPGAAEPAAAASPRQLFIGQPLRPEDEGQPAVVQGVVTFVGRSGAGLRLELSSEAGHMAVEVASAADTLDELLLRSRIRASGLCRGVHRGSDGALAGALAVPGAQQLTLLQVPEESWQHYPVRTVADALEAVRTNAAARIYHLRGKAKAYPDGRGFALVDNTGELVLPALADATPATGTAMEALASAERGASNVVLEGLVFRTIGRARARASALPLLTTTEQVRWLKPEEAGRRYPVRLRAVVTFVLGPPQQAVGNLQDASGGIFAWHLVPSRGKPPVKPGDSCEVQGTTSPGDFSPGIDCQKLTVLGPGEFPEPLRPTWAELASGSLDAQWVELEGIGLAFADNHLELGVQGGRISCYIPGPVEPARLLDAVIRVRGVVVADWDQARHVQGLHLNAPSQGFVCVKTPPGEDAFALPVKPIRDLLFYEPGESAFRREKVTGQVVGTREGLAYLMSGTNGLRLFCQDNPLPLAPGDAVEAVGFPEIDTSTEPPVLSLRQALVRVKGREPLPAAQPIPPGELPGSERDSTLVRLQARLVRSSYYGADQVLELQTGPRTVFARLRTSAGPLPSLLPGSLLSLTGVYALSQGKPGGRGVGGLFELLLNGPGDVAVLARPSWWTNEHALMVVAAMAVLIVLGLVWISLLRQQVGRRTAQLSAANASLANEIAEHKRTEDALVRTRLQHLVEQERTRIARDIHDELGCSLSQIRLLSELAQGQGAPTGDVQASAGRISAKALEATHVLDEIVWAVDPQNDTLEGLLSYLFNFASDYLGLAGVRFRIDAPPQIPQHVLTAQVRHQLYMGVKEILTNIVNHAQATEVRLRLRLEHGSACFVIEDNGRGFDLSAAADAPGASGLENLRRRFSELGGEFSVESAPAQGTRVSFILPLPAPSKP